jgi:aspartate/methionine/tyrosine aminotransferase
MGAAGRSGHGSRADRAVSDIQPFGIDKVAAAVGDASDLLRMENLDSDIPPPPAAVAATGDAVGRRDANSWLPFTGLAPLREAVAERLQQQTGRAYDPLAEVVITGGALAGVLMPCSPPSITATRWWSLIPRMPA